MEFSSYYILIHHFIVENNIVAIDGCRREVERLHDRFAEWFTDSLEEDGFERIESVLVPEFEPVTPEGTRLDREAVAEWLRDSYGRKDPDELEITVENVAVVASMKEHALVRYEGGRRRRTTGRA